MSHGIGNVGASRRSALRKVVSVGGIAAGLIAARRSDGTALGMLAHPAAGPAPGARANLAGVFDVRAFGAQGDGKTVDTPAVNKAIEAAAAAGGGTVLFPAGSYLSYSIRLKSRVSLYLGQGATIVAGETGQGGSYDAAEPNQWDMYQRPARNRRGCWRQSCESQELPECDDPRCLFSARRAFRPSRHGRGQPNRGQRHRGYQP
jgi:hypothetical protein